MTISTKFPLDKPPACTRCHNKKTQYRLMNPSNENANLRRPFYTCPLCDNETGKGFICFDDDLAIVNIECDCGSWCRLGRAGSQTSHPNYLFCTCASGQCNYWEWVPLKSLGVEVFEPVSTEIWENHIAVKDRLGEGLVLELETIQNIR